MKYKCVFYVNDSVREQRVSRSLAEGARRHGDSLELRAKGDYGKGRRWEGPSFDTDVVFAYGVKSVDILRDHHNAGTQWCILDKGYIRMFGPHRVSLYTRISVNETYPLQHFADTRPPPDDRWKAISEKARIVVRPRQHDGSYVLVTGSSQKFYDYFGCGDEKGFHRKIIRRLRGAMRSVGFERDIMFRPKPSYEKRHGDGPDSLFGYGAQMVSMPEEPILDVLKDAHCLVTFASNSACDAIFAGVPAIVLGPHVATPMANNDLTSIAQPFFPAEKDRSRWCARLGYEMWTLKEMANGEAWAEIRARLERGPIAEEWWHMKYETIPGWDESA